MGGIIVVITITLCGEMNNISDTRNAHTSFGCVETLPTGTHNESDTQVTVVWDITLSSSENQMSELPTPV